MGDAAAVEVVNGIVLGVAPGENAVKELAFCSALKGEVVICVGLKALVEFDLGE